MKNIPSIARGAVIPTSIAIKEMEEAKAKALRKQQYRHDWAIAIFGVLGGALAGFITTIITLKIQGLL